MSQAAAVIRPHVTAITILRNRSLRLTAMTPRPQITRRTLLAGSLAAGATPLLGRLAAAEDECKVTLTAINARPERAVSLRQVSLALAAGKPARLEGITRLDGYAIDDDNKDIALFGIAERGQPELEAADFVIALRSAFRRGIDPRDGTDYGKVAAISIDTDPEVFRRLHDFQTANAEGRRKYAELCKTPQKVRVDGMTRHSRVAKVLVDADYRMKRIGQGTQTLPISSPFPGDFEAKIREWRAQLQAGREPDVAVNLTRYWFTAGRFSHGVSDDGARMVRLKYAQVVLKDEDQVYRNGVDVATGAVNAYARAFTCAWTERMEDTYRAEPIWRDMYNMFRNFALARIMYDLHAFQKAGLDSEFLLQGYEPPRVEVPDALPGLSRMELYVRRRKGGASTTYSRTVCGGVSVGCNKPIEKEPDTDGEIQRAGLSVLGSRPAGTALAWNVTPDALKVITDRPSAPKPVAAPAPAAAPGKPGTIEELFKPHAPAPEASPAPGKPPALQDLFRR
jgi:hypothetical protein